MNQRYDQKNKLKMKKKNEMIKKKINKTKDRWKVKQYNANWIQPVKIEAFFIKWTKIKTQVQNKKKLKSVDRFGQSEAKAVFITGQYLGAGTW